MEKKLIDKLVKIVNDREISDFIDDNEVDIFIMSLDHVCWGKDSKGNDITTKKERLNILKIYIRILKKYEK